MTMSVRIVDANASSERRLVDQPRRAVSLTPNQRCRNLSFSCSVFMLLSHCSCAHCSFVPATVLLTSPQNRPPWSQVNINGAHHLHIIITITSATSVFSCIWLSSSSSWKACWLLVCTTQEPFRSRRHGHDHSGRNQWQWQSQARHPPPRTPRPYPALTSKHIVRPTEHAATTTSHQACVFSPILNTYFRVYWFQIRQSGGHIGIKTIQWRHWPMKNTGALVWRGIEGLSTGVRGQSPCGLL